jgi:ribulose 1,5-bisphosphate synthetase/thiazole synthase
MPLHVAAHLQHPAAFSTITSARSTNCRKRLTQAALTLRCAQSVRSEVDVAIVGGGPGGLAAAAAIVSALGDDVRVRVKA